MSEAAPSADSTAAPAEPVQPDLVMPASGAPAPAAEPVLTDVPAWRQSLPEELRNHEQLAAYDDRENPTAALAQDLINAQGLIGRKGIIPPKDDSPEELARFYKELGRPDTPDGYDMEDFEIPEGLPINEGLISPMLEKFHARGLSQDQALGVLADYVELQSGAYEEANAEIARAQQDAEAALNVKWGSKYEERANSAARFAKAALGDNFDAFQQAILPDGTRLGDNAAIVEWMSELARATGEDSVVGDPSKSLGTSPEEAAREYNEMRTDPEVGTILAEGPRNRKFAETRDKMRQLSEIAYGTEVIEEVGGL